MPKYRCDKFSDNLFAIFQWQWSMYTWIWMQLSYDVYICVVSDFCLSLYLHVADVWESPGKMSLGYWKVLEKSKSHPLYTETCNLACMDSACKQLMLSRRSDSDWSCVPADFILNTWRSADGHVTGTGHAQTTPGEYHYLSKFLRCVLPVLHTPMYFTWWHHTSCSSMLWVVVS